MLARIDNASIKCKHINNAKSFKHGTHYKHAKHNATRASWVGSMRRRGMSAAAIEAALLAENTMRCDPPLSELSRLAEVMKGSRPTLTLESKQGGRRHG
jgi:hypothetical protein